MIHLCPKPVIRATKYPCISQLEKWLFENQLFPVPGEPPLAVMQSVTGIQPRPLSLCEDCTKKWDEAKLVEAIGMVDWEIPRCVSFFPFLHVAHCAFPVYNCVLVSWYVTMSTSDRIQD